MNETTNISPKSTPSKSLRLAARIIGTLWVLICLLLFIGNVIEQNNKNPGAVPKSPDIFGIAIVVCLSIAMGGLIIAWWREGTGVK